MALLVYQLLINSIEQLMNSIILRKQLWYRPANRIRLEIGLVLLIAASTALNYIQLPFIINMAVMFTLGIAYALTCFESKRETRVFWGGAVYMITMLCNILADDIRGFFTLNFPVLGNDYLAMAISILAVALIYVPFVYIKKNVLSFPRSLRTFIAIISLVCAVVGVCLADISRGVGSESHEGTYVIVLTVSLLAVVYGSIYIMGEIGMVTMYAVESYNRRKQEELHNTIGSFRHDFANHLTMVGLAIESGNYEKAQDYIRSLNIRLDKIRKFADTGNETLDSLLSNKSAAAKNSGIAVDISAAWHDSVSISDMDIVAVFANLLDNAIEACKAMPEGVSRYIIVQIIPVSDMLQINIKNSYSGNYKRSGSTLLTTKEESGHGIGLKNVERICQNAGGYMRATPGRDEFEVAIALPITKGISNYDRRTQRAHSI